MGLRGDLQEMLVMYIRPRGCDLHRAHPEEFLAFVVAYRDFYFACLEARDCGLPACENALSWSFLRGKGVSDGILLWMMYQAHIEHLYPAGSDSERQAGIRKARNCNKSTSSLTAFVVTV